MEYRSGDDILQEVVLNEDRERTARILQTVGLPVDWAGVLRGADAWELAELRYEAVAARTAERGRDEEARERALVRLAEYVARIGARVSVEEIRREPARV